MDVLKKLEALQAEAESTGDIESAHQVGILIEQARPMTQRDVSWLIDKKIKDALQQ